eukprot:scaffold72815_cov86-Phaeocystis_antarctica.AAC.2
MLAQRHARGRNGLPLGRRSCDGPRVRPARSRLWLRWPYDRRSRGRRSPSASTVGRVKLVKDSSPPRCGHVRCSEMWRDTVGCGEMQRGAARCSETWGGVLFEVRRDVT